MHIFKNLFFITFLSFLISFTGCQSNNSGVSDDPLPVVESNINNSAVVEQNTTLPEIDIDATDEVEKLSIVNGTDITVHSSGEQKDIYIVAFNSNGSTTTEGEITFQWPLEFIDKGIDFGTILPPKATITDGRVHFTYTAPSNLKAREESGYSGVKFLFHSTKMADVNVTLSVDFNSSGDYTSSEPLLKSLVLSDSSIKIKSSKQINNLIMYAYTDQSTTDITTSLRIKYPKNIVGTGIDIGTLPSKVDIIDGRAELKYVGPTNLAKTLAKLKLLNLSNSIILNLYNQDTAINVDLNLTFLADQKYDNYKLTAVTDTTKITQPNQSRVIDIYLKADEKKPAVEETVVIDYFDGSFGEMNSFSGVTDSNGHIAFEYQSPKNITNLKDFNLTFRVANSDSLSITTAINIDLSIENSDYSKYKLSTVSGNSVITDSLQSKVIDIYLENDKARPASDESILLKYFDGSYGTVNSFSGVTDANGHVAFEYTSVNNVKNGDDYTLSFILENNSSISIDKLLSVNVNRDKKDYTGYSLVSLPASSIITENAQQKTVEIYLEDANNRPAKDELVIVDYFDGSVGRMSSFSGVTDANGHLAFQYTAPDIIIDGMEYNLTFKLENNTTFSDITQLKVDKSVTLSNKDYTGYTLISVPTSTTITEVSQSKVLDIYFEDANKRPAEGESIVLDYFDGRYGTMNSFSATTDANGHVAFEYTAIESLVDGTDYNLTFSLESNANINTTSTLTVDTTVTSVDYTNYTLSVLPSSFVITQSFQKHNIKLYLEDDNEAPARNQSILLKYFYGINGTVDSFEMKTDNNGEVTFKYESPEDLTEIAISTLTFRLADDSSKEVNSTFTINTELSKPSIHLQNSEITLTENEERVDIKILAFDENNQTLEEGSIIVRFPTEIIDNNVSGGSFLEREVEIVNGEAIFTLIAPNPLVALANPLEFTFVYTGNETITAPLIVNYEPAIARIADINDINLTINSQVITIDILVFDADNSPYPDGDVKIIYPTDVLTGRDIGSFESSIVALIDGKATFTYTAPTQLDNNTSDIIFNFYHESQRSVMKELKIEINPDPNQVVLTTYSIKSSLKDNNVTMDLKSSKFISFNIEDVDRVLVPDENITNFSVILLNPALGILEDTTGRTGYRLEFNEKNSITVNLVTDSISGVIPLKVETTFSDINNNEQNLTEIFNILVQSGPPTAISLSYAGTITKDKDLELELELESRAKFAERWVVTVTDKYNNLVNTHPAISTGIMLGYTQSSDNTSNDSNYLYFNPSEDKNGTIDVDNQNFKVDNEPFENVDQTNEYLVTFGNGYSYNASGKWDINTDTNDTLDLIDKFEGNSTSNLGFAVGYNYRQDRCEEGVEWVANTYPENNNYTIDDTGTIKIIVEYDYYLVGKSVMLWANLIGSNNGKTVRIGEARKITLRGLGLMDVSTIEVPNGTGSKMYRFNISVKGTDNWYSNAKFSYRVDSKNLIINSEFKSNLDNCIAYVDINVTDNNSSDMNISTLTLKNLKIIDEF